MTEPDLDLYGLLGVHRTATPGEIHRAYRDRARRAHPDVARRPTADDMVLLNMAWSVLGDAERRAAYDERSARPPPGSRVSVPRDEALYRHPDDRFDDSRMLNGSAQRLLRVALVVTVLLVMVMMIALFLIGFGRVGA